MAHTHEFDCRICGAHLDSREELDRHNSKEHGQQASSSSNSSNVNASGSSSSTGSSERL